MLKMHISLHESAARTVQDRSGVDVRVELPLHFREQRVIQLFLLGTEVFTLDDDGPWGQAEIVCPLYLIQAVRTQSRTCEPNRPSCAEASSYLVRYSTS